MSFVSLAFDFSVCSRSARSAASSFCSPRICISSSFARCRSFSSRIASACASLSLKRFMSTGFGSSSVRMILMTASMFRYATSKPSRMCSRCVTRSRRCCSRRFTVAVRNVSHSSSKRLQAVDGRPAVQADHVDVHADGALEIGRREQVIHQRVEVDLAGLRRQHEARGILVVGLVAQVLHHRQLLGRHLRGDLLEHLRARGLERQLVDHDLAVLDLDSARAGAACRCRLCRSARDPRGSRRARRRSESRGP